MRMRVRARARVRVRARVRARARARVRVRPLAAWRGSRGPRPCVRKPRNELAPPRKKRSETQLG